MQPCEPVPAEEGFPVDGEAKAAFHLALRARGVRDLQVLRAMERVPRALFVAERFAALARDLPLPLAGGQTTTPAWVTARMIEALSLQPGHRVLHVGAGSGYATAVLAHLCAEVVACERVRTLADAAAARLAALGIVNAVVHWADGAALGGTVRGYDCILVHACVPEPDLLFPALARDAIMVCARPTADGQSLTRHVRTGEGWEQRTICACRLPMLGTGLARHT